MLAISRLSWILALGGALLSTAVRADTIDLSGYLDPATLHIGAGANVACDVGGCPIYGNEVNATSTQLSIYQQSGGANALASPVLLILGVPNNPAYTNQSFMKTAVTGASLFAPYNPFPASNGTPTPVTTKFGTTSLIGDASTGYVGNMTAGQEVYGFLGVGDSTNNSNSFTNWAAADLAKLGLTVSDFGIYVYELDTTNFAGQDLLDVTLSSLIPDGTFAVAFGVDTAGKKAYGTPFTEAGLNTTGPVPPPPPPVAAPEPSTLALFGGLLLALAAVRGLRRV